MVEQLQQSPKNKFKMESLDTEKSAILLELNDKSQQLADLFRGLINVQGEDVASRANCTMGWVPPLPVLP